MGRGSKIERRLLLSYCSFTCIYLSGILILVKINDNLYNVGQYKFLPVLLALTFAEVIKLLFPRLQTEMSITIKLEQRGLLKPKRSWTRSFKEIMKFTFSALALSIIYYIVIILFGAPVLSDREGTAMLVITLLILTFVPASLHLGVGNALELLINIQSQKDNILAEALRTNVIMTILGTWLGATVIPLDWDRPWQVWPIPCVIGALLGYMSAHFITLSNVLPLFKLREKIHL